MRIILGIGNPGPTYAGTRHNVGWFVLDAIAAAHSLRWREASGPFLEATVPGESDSFVLVRPLTYVNRCGEAAIAACDRHGAIPSDLLVVLDDAHLRPGDLRLRRGGSTGGHNGLASIVASLATDEVPRLRIGIGAPARSGALVEHVLAPFVADEEPVIRRAVEQAAGIAVAFGRVGFDRATDEYSRLRAAIERSVSEADAPKRSQ